MCFVMYILPRKKNAKQTTQNGSDCIIFCMLFEILKFIDQVNLRIQHFPHYKIVMATLKF